MKREHLTDEVGNKTANWFNIDAAESFKESKTWNGHNWISDATGDQFHHQKLYITTKKRFILCSWSDYSGSRDTTITISKIKAVEWLIRNNYYDEVEAAHMELLAQYEV